MEKKRDANQNTLVSYKFISLIIHTLMLTYLYLLQVSDSESERAGIETEAEMWEHIGTSDVESEDDEEADDEAEEAEKEEEVVETKRGWFW